MKRTTARVTAAAVAAMMAMASLSGCGVMSSASKEVTTQSTTSTQQDSKEIHDLVLAHLASTEISTFNLLNSQTRADIQYLTNMLDGMVEADSYGNIVPGIATDWVTEDGGKTWTFHLRDNVTWVDVNGNEKAKLTADDFMTGMEWVLNFYKNDSANVSMPSEMIQGAKEYYEYTKTLTEEQAYQLTAGDGSKFREMVGIETPDDYTLVYHCTAAKPYFDTVMAYICMYPMAQGMVDELGVEGVQGMNNENMWYNGCYLMTSYVQGNEKLFVPNPAYWDSDCKRFDSITVKMVESNDVAYQLYQSGETDYVELSESNIKTISSDENNPYHDKMVEWKKTFSSIQMKFNYDKRNEDGSDDNNWNRAVANENFRKAWYYGLDFTDYFSRYNAINPMSCENNTYTMNGLCYTSDGTDYTELVKKELGLAEENGETLHVWTALKQKNTNRKQSRS